MENVKSYVEALDPSVPDIVKIVKKPLEGLQNRTTASEVDHATKHTYSLSYLKVSEH